jgi:hypothetical protein
MSNKFIGSLAIALFASASASNELTKIQGSILKDIRAQGTISGHIFNASVSSTYAIFGYDSSCTSSTCACPASPDTFAGNNIYACQDNSDGSVGSSRYYCEQATYASTYGVDFYLENYFATGCQGKPLVTKYSFGHCFYYVNMICPVVGQKPWADYHGLLSLQYSGQCGGDPSSFEVKPDGCHKDSSVASTKSFCDVNVGGTKDTYSSSTTCSSGAMTSSVVPLIKCDTKTFASTCCTADDTKC